MLRNSCSTRERPTWGVLGGGVFTPRLAVEFEQSSIGFAKTGHVLFLVDLALDRGRKCGMRCFTSWASPVLLRRHPFDQRLGVEWFFRFPKDLGGSIEGRHLLGWFLRRGLFGRRLRRCSLLRSSSFTGCLLGRCFLRSHGSFPFGARCVPGNPHDRPSSDTLRSVRKEHPVISLRN